jgi:hypothetical protein
MSDVENQAVETADDWIVDSSDAPEVTETTEEVEAVEVTEEAPNEDLELVIDGEAVPPTADEDEIELPEDAPNWAQQLRQRQKELARENKALKQQAAVAPAVQHDEPKELPEPTLESCDWDEVEFRKQTKDWALNQAKVEAAKAKQQSEEESFAAELQKKQQSYAVRKAEVLKQAPDYAAAESAVTSALSPATQNMILDLAKDPAAVVLAAGRNKALLQELASLQTNPIKLAAKIGELNRTASFAPKVKQGFATEPKVKAANTKPPSAADAAFNAKFPDAKFS